MSAVSPGLGVLILGNSVLGGRRHRPADPARLHPRDDRLTDLTSRAKAFGVISGMGASAPLGGPLTGGVITTAISWRAAFVFQALVVATIILLSRRMVDPLPPDPTRRFDAIGAVLSAWACSSSSSGSCRRTTTSC